MEEMLMQPRRHISSYEAYFIMGLKVGETSGTQKCK
jgi:hypothetical protein